MMIGCVVKYGHTIRGYGNSAELLKPCLIIRWSDGVPFGPFMS
jgi:hypothetical protein